MEDTNYTGIGVSCGGGLCNVALTTCRYGADVQRGQGRRFHRHERGRGDGGEDEPDPDGERREVPFQRHYADKVQQALTVYYDDMIHRGAGADEALRGSRQVPKLNRQVPLVLSGGGEMPEGFQARFEKALRAANLPVPVSEVRLAGRPLHTTAHGALVAALSE